MSSHLVRKATKTDLSSICVIEDDSFPDPYPPALIERLQSEHAESFFVVENAKRKVVGYCVASANARMAHLISIGVLRAHQRRGAGEALLGTLIDWLKERNFAELWLEVNAGNSDAIRFYEQFGFEKVMMLENYYSDGSRALRMRLRMLKKTPTPTGNGRGRKK